MSLPPLLRRTQLRPGESLPSLLERLTKLNYYGHTPALDWICRQHTPNPSQWDHVMRPRHARTFALLSELSQLDSADLWAASEHRFASMLTVPGREPALLTWLDGTRRPMVTTTLAGQRLRPPTAAQFCPCCLHESAHHRWNWIPVAAALCLHHQCLLVQHCPHCGQPVTVADIVACQCQICLTDLRQTTAVSVTGDGLGLLSQQVIQAWFAGDPALAGLPGGALPDHPPHVLYHLLDRLRLSLTTGQEDWPNLPDPLAGLAQQMPLKLPRRRLPPDCAYYLYRAAFQGLLDWPQGFYHFLDAYSQRHPQTPIAQSLTKRLGAGGAAWLQQTRQQPEFEFVQQSFVTYLVTRQIPLPDAMVKQFQDTPWFVERSGLWTTAQTAQALGLSEQMVEWFSTYGPLRPCLWPASHSCRPLFNRAAVLALQQQWAAGLPLEHASHWLGLDTREVVRLVERGVLTRAHSQPSADRATWLVDQQSVRAFCAAVVSQLILYEGPASDLLPLCMVAHFMPDCALDSALLLQYVAEGILPGYKRTPEPHSPGGAYLLDATVGALPDIIYGLRGWIRDGSFAQQRGVECQIISTWVDLGLIEPRATCGYRKYFDLESLERLTIAYLDHG